LPPCTGPWPARRGENPFDFGIGRAKVDKMRAEYEKLLHTKASAEMNIPIQVAKTYQEHLEWQAALESYRKAASAARRWILTAQADFDMGVGSAYDMLNAIDRYGQNQGKYLEALFRHNLSLAELEYAAGVKTW
jgi:outer membrane protein TolC